FQVAFESPNGTPINFFDGWGLANWMTSLNLTAPSGSPLPLATPSCKEWVSSVASCLANVTGWYAVLLSSSGEWLASYGLSGTGAGWAVPVLALVSHQQIVIVLPNSWGFSGDTLNVVGTVSTSRVSGSLGL
ncbi:MAG: hypothetical protein L3J97_06775, partial [Thermoplasmata archaeon]|nr:hypothetical protein [Thermoplasmata archaeon]